MFNVPFNVFENFILRNGLISGYILDQFNKNSFVLNTALILKNSVWWTGWYAILFFSLILFIIIILLRKYIFGPFNIIDGINRNKNDNKFYNIISSEIRTPVSLISDSISKLEEEKPEIVELIIIKENIEKLKNLINKIEKLGLLKENKNVKESEIFTSDIAHTPGLLHFNPNDILTKFRPADIDNLQNIDFNDEDDIPHNKTILVIDDNRQICDFLEELLTDDYKVIKESDSYFAMARVLENMPDLILCDIMMPRISGIEICKAIKTDVRTCHIPVIFITAKVTVEDHITGYETGADDYVYKPFNSKILLSRIKNLIKQREKLRTHFIGNDGLLNNHISSNTLDKTFIDNIYKIIKENYQNQDFTVNSIVEQLGMSRSVFYKKFKALSNQPINDVIKDFRLNRAKELLLVNNQSISDIAYKTGFSDPAYFSKVFKEYFKITPKAFNRKKDK